MMKLAKSWMREEMNSVSIERGWGLTKGRETLRRIIVTAGNVPLCPFLVKTTPGLIEPPLSIMTLGHMEECWKIRK